MNRTQKPYNIRNISSAEMQLRRDMGLCFTCDEKFSFSHRRPNRHLMILQVDEDENTKIDLDHLTTKPYKMDLLRVSIAYPYMP